jgi:hypothetical protein
MIPTPKRAMAARAIGLAALRDDFVLMGGSCAFIDEKKI